MPRTGPVLAFVCAVVLLCATTAQGQTEPPLDLTKISLEELMQAEIQTVSSASRFEQDVTTAPASVTIVTADEIRRFGHRSLKDILDSVRGLYTADDRNYSYAGVRGFARPGDYNTRILLLVDGHRINDLIYDSAPLGDYLAVDVESIQRVEVIRGPGSSLYGSSAFFAVLNVITRNAVDARGVRAGADAGSLGLRRGRASVGHVFGSGANLFVAASAQDEAGHDSLYFPEFDSAATSFGIVRDGDAQTSGRVFGSLTMGRIAVRGSFVERAKHVPTAAFGTVFGDSRNRTVDTAGSAAVSYDGPFARGWHGVARLSYDHIRYRGDYVYDVGAPERGLFSDSAVADWFTTELTLNKRVGTRHQITTGAEVRQSVRQHQRASDPTVQTSDDTRTGTWGVFLQDEFTLVPQLVLNGGVRLDHDGSFGLHLAPRAALIYRPAKTTAVKLLHGRAFRAPNAYELYYYEVPAESPALAAETIATTEGIWEQYFGRHLRTSLSVFQSDIEGLISQGLATAEVDGVGTSWVYFGNLASARARGVESEVEGRWANGVLARASHALVDTRDDDGLRLSNSPRHLTKLALALPVAPKKAGVALEGQYLGSRLPLNRSTLPGVFFANLTLTSGALLPRAELSLSVRNLFDARYGIPGGQEHVQRAIEQDGRTVRVGVTVGF